MTAPYTVTSCVEMIELFYSKIHALSMWANTWLTLCASVPVNVTFYV